MAKSRRDPVADDRRQAVHLPPRTGQPVSVLADARQRRGTPADDAPGWTLASHLSQIIAEADKVGAAYVLPVKHRVTYSLTVPPGPALKAGSVVRVWLPFPQEHRRQTEVHLISSSPAGATIAPADAPQRTVYLETRVIDPHQPVVCREVLEFTSAAYYPKLDDARAAPSRGLRRGNRGRARRTSCSRRN